MAPPRIAITLAAIADHHRELERQLAGAAVAHMGELAAQRFLAELPLRLRDVAILRKGAAFARAEGLLPTRVPRPGPGWPWDAAATLLRLKQGRPWVEAERAVYAELSRREKHRARKIVERRLLPQTHTGRRRDPETLRSSRALTRSRRWAVEEIAFLVKEVTGKFPGFTRRDSDTDRLSGSALLLVKAALDWALWALPTVELESIVRWLRDLRRDGKPQSERITTGAVSVNTALSLVERTTEQYGPPGDELKGVLDALRRPETRIVGSWPPLNVLKKTLSRFCDTAEERDNLVAQIKERMRFARRTTSKQRVRGNRALISK